MFSEFSVSEFLQRYWQRKAVVLKGDFVDLKGIVDGDELAGLACEEAVESRIIQGFGLDGPWSCQQGPFIDFDYDSLGSSNWTLLVQGLDQWDERVSALLERFDFLPAWRLEDVMASFAPIGGGVGPHFDYYDVFLIQASGKRRWELGSVCDDTTALQDNASVKLLEQFESTSVHDLVAGDALYVPAGLAHCGTSLSDDCVTLSVGFRAPSDTELLVEAIELLAPTLRESLRYKDTHDSIDSDRYKINAAAKNYARNVVARLEPNALGDALEEALGRLVTDTRYCSYSEDETVWTGSSVKQRMAENGQQRLTVDKQPHCRMAYSDSHLFVNGGAYESAEWFSQSLCEGSVEVKLGDKQWAILAALLNDDMIVLT